MSKTHFNHYTDEEGAKGIEESGVIRASVATPSTDDAVAGPGVYVTKLPPSTPDNALLMNNYDSNWAKEENQHNVSHVVELNVPRKEARNFEKVRTDVYVHKDDIHIQKYDGKVSKRK